MRNVSLNRRKGINWGNLIEEEFQSLLPINKNQFEALLSYYDPVPVNEILRQIKRKE